jgi:flagellar FliJ protein
MSESLVGRVDVARIRQHARHAGHVTQRAQHLAVSLLGIERRVEQAREALLAASRARKAIELLRDKHERRWRREAERREAAAIDEIATQAHVRRMRGAVA